MNKEQFIKIARITLIILIIVTLVFIYVRSTKSPEASIEESDKVGDIIAEIIPPETKPGEYIQTNLRKLAHFTEFFVLGIEIALYVVFFWNNKLAFGLSYPLGILLGFFDETIQIFVERGAEIKDVWIDFLGYALAVSSVYIAYFVAIKVIDLYKKRKMEQ